MYSTARSQLPSHLRWLSQSHTRASVTRSTQNHTRRHTTRSTADATRARRIDSLGPCQVESYASCPTPPKRHWTLRMDLLVWTILFSIGVERMSYASYITLISALFTLFSFFLSLLSQRKPNDTALSSSLAPTVALSRPKKHHILEPSPIPL